MSRQPAPPPGTTLSDLRRGVVTVGPHDGTQERRRKRMFFKQALLQWVQSGGVCDLLAADQVESSSVSAMPDSMKAMALGHSVPLRFVAAPEARPSGHALGLFEPEEPMFSPDEEGYCYLDFVRSDARNHAVDSLGYNPWSSSIAAWLLENPSVHSTGRYKVDLGPPKSGGGFVQMHVTSCSNGLTWQEALRLGPVNTRVGAAPGPTMATAMQHAEMSGPRSVLTVAPRGNGIEIPVPFGFVIQSHTGGKRVKWDPATSKSMRRLTQYFESVELLSMHVAAVVHEGGPTTLLRLAINQYVQPPESDVDWITSPHSLMLSGNSQTGTAAELSLPANHSFGRQLKGVNIGNPSPAIHALLSSPNASYAYCKGLIRVRVVGSGLPDAIRVGTYDKSVANTESRVVSRITGGDREFAGPSRTARHSPTSTVVAASVSGATAVESEGGEEESDDDEDSVIGR